MKELGIDDNNLFLNAGQPEYTKGDTIYWQSVHGGKSGIIENIEGNSFYVRLNNGRDVLIDKRNVRDINGNKID